mmetsp:Transcript_24028/g.56053  ORF Transcript_24028/g.56053 Transcript_24028/m.56053 type:complete len:129 (+) Transcript_24028:846-1232(+)
MEQARVTASKWTESRDGEDESPPSAHDSNASKNKSSGSGSVASLGSGLAQHARSIVGSFSCTGMTNERSGVLESSVPYRSKSERLASTKSFSTEATERTTTPTNQSSYKQSRRARPTSRRDPSSMADV